ncbi:hypothetical protein AVEN_146663-1 [Araneus ventricosus]|uniref:Uncharacterized protein n=1 Tax=Araneus ventricosus TaxID=182803 RepID=A0A4Y2KPZ1_ARAVE|nr:hypothetical protein AVEN_146663-1 [Araneus ventricosus]
MIFCQVQHLLTSAKKLQADLSKLLRRGGFELHKWVSNYPALFNDMSTSECSFEDTQSNTVKAIGMLWKPQPNQLTFKVSVNNKDSLTKREVLSQIAKLYDPLGIIGPVIAKAKIFMQSLWLQKLDWNDNLPTKVLHIWNDFLVKLPAVNEINVPRYILSDEVAEIELHGFFYASEVPTVRLYTSDVSPIQDSFKLNSCAANQGQNLSVDGFNNCSSLVEYATSPAEKLCQQPSCKNSKPLFQFSVGACLIKNNPADVLSRGADARHLRDSDLWWQGPEFLLRDIRNSEEFPCPKDKTFEQELKRNVTVSCAVTND